MSRIDPRFPSAPVSFPRVSGDEPGDTLTVFRIDRFSPRERG